MATFAVTYTYADDSTDARNEHRAEHKDFLEAQFNAKRLLVSGPLGPDDSPGALLIFGGDSVEEIAALLDNDPFARENLIKKREIRSWNIFFGGLRER